MRRELWILALLAACVDETRDDESTLEAPRVVAVESVPAESAPGESVHLRAIVAAPPGSARAALAWSLCTTPRAPVDNTAVSPACATTRERPLEGDALELDLTIPPDACRVFGSETPAGSAPNAADGTGGYYQPVRVALGEHITVVRQRLRCALAGAPIEVAQAFARDYQPNRAPAIGAVHAWIAGVEYPLDALPHAPQVELRVELAEAEAYLRYDEREVQLRTERERQTASWFTNAGRVSPARSELAGTVASATWQVPSDVESALVWLIVQDDRGASTTTTVAASFVR
ncbi:MAG TPA: hypothetical protein VI299_23150 [Polyangiales bacterium]